MSASRRPGVVLVHGRSLMAQWYSHMPRYLGNRAITSRVMAEPTSAPIDTDMADATDSDHTREQAALAVDNRVASTYWDHDLDFHRQMKLAAENAMAYSLLYVTRRGPDDN